MTNFQEPRDKLSIATAALAWLPPALTTMLSLLSLLRIFSYPKPLRQLFGLIKELFSPLVTPEDLFTPEEIRTRRIPPSQWRSVILTSAAALLCIGWFTIAGYVAATRPLAALHPTAMAVAWLSPATSLAIRPSTRPDYSVLALSILQIVFHGQRIWTSARSLRDIFQSATLGTHLLAVLLCLILIGTILSKPILDIPTSDNMAHLTEKEVSEDYTNPEDRVNLAQWISFTWISSMLAKGSRMDLTVQDVWQLSPLNWAQSLHNKFKEKSQHSIGLRLLRLNWADIIADGGLQIIVTIIDFAPAFFTKKILEALALPPPLRYAAFKWAVLALVLDLVGAQLGTLHSFHASRALLRMRTQLLSALHEKTLLRRDMSGVVTQQKSRMDDNDLDYSSASTGRIVNLLSSDTSNVINSLTYLLMLLEVPIQLVIALFFLYTLLGWASFAGLAVLAVTIPLNNWITRQNKSIMKELFKARDERINQVNTFVRAIRFIRSNDWQDRWQEKILASREKELRLLTNRRFSSLGLGLIWQLSPPAIIVLSFAAFTLLMKQPLTVPIAFVAISLFGNLSGPLSEPLS